MGGWGHPLHWGFHLWAVMRLINEGCNDGGCWCWCMDGCFLPVWCCEEDQAPQPPSAPGPGWHGGQGVLSPSVPCPSWHIHTGIPLPWAGWAQQSGGVEGGVTGIFWGAGGALWGGQLQPQRLGRAALPHPTLPFPSGLVAA